MPANPTYDDLVTTTIKNRRRKLADNVTKNNGILTKLKEQGKVMPWSGGRELVEEISHRENQTYKRYSGYDSLNIRPSQVLSAAAYGIKQAAVAVTISGLEMLQNAGKEAMIALSRARITVAEATMMNNLASDIYSNGMADAGRQIDGLRSLISSDPTTGVVGGIDREQYSFWRNHVQSGVTVANDGEVKAAMRKMYLATRRGNDTIDLFVGDNNTYDAFWATFQDRQRYSGKDTALAKAGFDALVFNQAAVIADGGVGGGCPANQMYGLNCDYLSYRPHSKRDMTPLPKRYSTDQDASVTIIAWAGNLTMRGAQYQSILVGS